jgi:tripartite-type tricarboxylate transporter receptor subunit TctC
MQHSLMTSCKTKALAFLLFFAPLHAQAKPFYEGKSLTIVVGSAAGSVYDAYTRILAAYMPKYLPGHPSIIVQDMPGAGGVTATYYMLNSAPRDGTVIASAISTIPTTPIVHPEMASYDPTKFSWIGSMTKDIFIAYVWRDAPIKSYEDAKRKQAILGALAVGNVSFDAPMVSNALFGTKFKLITGYDDQGSVRLALERGEIQGAFGAGYSSVKTSDADWLRDKKIRIILQLGFQKSPELADVPLLIDQAKTLEERQILTLLLTPQEFLKPYFAPPDVPRERLAQLRRAFDQALKDPGLLGAAANAHLQILDPMTGEKLAETVATLNSTPKPAVERVRQILAAALPK